MNYTIEQLTQKAHAIRREVVSVAMARGAGHIAPSLSCVDILVALYYGIMNYDPAHPDGPERDRMILSKGHGCYGLYAILEDLGVIPRSIWRDFYTERNPLSGCVERRLEYGLEASCGSLGHGLPMAVGIAWAAQQQGHCYHTFCLMGDGEMQEGTTWEALQFAVKHRLGNLTLIVDRNRLQAMDFTNQILEVEDTDLDKKLTGFGLRPRCCAGHDQASLMDCLSNSPGELLAFPQAIIAKTVKGYGLYCMENVPRFHFRIPTADELQQGNRYD